MNFTRARVSLALLVVYTNPHSVELCHKIYQNCIRLRILRSTIEPANSFSQFFLTVALLLLSFVLQFLLKSGKGRSLVEEYDKYENTPLHVAAKKGYVRIIQVSSNSRVSLKAGTGPEHPPDGSDPSGNTLHSKNWAKNYKTKNKNKKSCSGMFRKRNPGCSRPVPAFADNNNSPIQDYVHPDDHTLSTYEMTPGFKPFTFIKV